jgi:hypothetical protein
VGGDYWGDFKYLFLIFTVYTINLKIALFSLSPGACLREAASAKVGERAGVRGDICLHPHAQRRRLRRVPQSSPVKGEENYWLFSWFEGALRACDIMD